MNEETASDALLEGLLLDRAGDHAPIDLRSAISIAVRQEVGDGRRGRIHRLAIDRRSRSIRLVAVAAILVTAVGGAALVTGGSERADTTLRPTAVTAIAPTTATVSDPPQASAAVLAGPDFSGTHCRDVPIVTGPTSDSLDDPSEMGPNGDLLVSVSSGGGYSDLVRLDPAAAADPRPFGLALESIASVSISTDGRLAAVAAEDGGVDCRQPVIVRTDGSGPRFAIDLDARATLSDPVWSAVGSTLYMIHSGPLGPSASGEPPIVDRGSVWALDAVSGAVRSLGSPCDGCWIRELQAVPGSDGVAATISHAGCYEAEACPVVSLAIAGADGAWDLVDVKSLPRFGLLMGWRDARTFVAIDYPGIYIVPLDDPAAAVLVADGCCANGSATLSPDGSHVLRYGARPGMHQVSVIDLADDSLRAVGELSPLDDRAPLFAWSPDGRSIAAVRGDGMEAEAFVVDVATGTWRRIATGPITSLTWLPSVP